MKKDREMPDSVDELRTEYDFSELAPGVRGKYADRYAVVSNTVRLDPDVAAAFPTSESVNQALRMLIRLAKTQVPDK